MSQQQDKPDNITWQRLASLWRDGVIVSVQAAPGEPLNRPDVLEAMALSVLSGGACGLRMANTEDDDHIGYFKARHPDVPVIGLTKPAVMPEDACRHVYITPTNRDIERLVAAKADVIALDATGRPHPEASLRDIVRTARRDFPWVPLMADIATLSEGLTAEMLGFDCVSTTLSGYTEETRAKAGGGPDFDLLEALVRQVRIPVILEGRVWHPEEVARAFALGAFAVVIGSAITRPHHITQRFCAAVPRH